MHLIMKIHQVKQEKPKKIPAFTQENGLGRLQTALKVTNEQYYNLMKAFYKKYVSLLFRIFYLIKRELLCLSLNRFKHVFLKFKI